MTTAFEQRERFSREQAHEMLMQGSNRIWHLLDNGDGTYSIMGHIVCEYCDYCEAQGDCRGDTKPPVAAKPDAYELQRLQGFAEHIVNDI